jgi:hypothetical protein
MLLKCFANKYYAMARYGESPALRLFFFTPLLLMMLGCERSAPAENSHRTAFAQIALKDRVPEKALNYLNDNLRGWKIADTSDYAGTWWSFYDKKQIPYSVSVDLNDDQVLDYGCIIRNSDSIRLVILRDSAGTFVHWMSPEFRETFTGKDIAFGLTVEPPKRIDVIGEQNSLILKSNGIALMNFENRSRVYYWDEGEGEFRVFVTDDHPR